MEEQWFPRAMEQEMDRPQHTMVVVAVVARVEHPLEPVAQAIKVL
jgi:hypothetical protein